MSERDDNVIHVVFGGDGGYRILRDEPVPAAPVAAPSERRAERVRGDDPLSELYDRREVARLFELTESRLRSWDRTGVASPSARRGRRRLYSFQDLIAIRAAKSLVEAGVPAREVRQSVEAIRAALPKIVRPLAELRVVAEGQVMLVRDEAGTYEPRTGQLVLDFHVQSLRDDVVRVLHTEPTAASRRTAYDRYLDGCRLDEDPTTWDAAEEAYRDALRLDPSLANAFTNLGNLRFRRADPEGAEAHYLRALQVDPEQPEALYNLGFLRVERGLLEAAVPYFLQALASDPGFADAHFHVAAALEELGQRLRARPHWQAYLELEPEGEWADAARARLEER
ncbi:MAG: tetratricopeptide repeat protein [Myxococcales bacterium]|nr:tetratricopeptide repeat protein [Myxococcales bacterium]